MSGPNQPAYDCENCGRVISYPGLCPDCQQRERENRENPNE